MLMLPIAIFLPAHLSDHPPNLPNVHSLARSPFARAHSLRAQLAALPSSAGPTARPSISSRSSLTYAPAGPARNSPNVGSGRWRRGCGCPRSRPRSDAPCITCRPFAPRRAAPPAPTPTARTRSSPAAVRPSRARGNSVAAPSSHGLRRRRGRHTAQDTCPAVL